MLQHKVIPGRWPEISPLARPGPVRHRPGPGRAGLLARSGRPARRPVSLPSSGDLIFSSPVAQLGLQAELCFPFHIESILYSSRGAVENENENEEQKLLAASMSQKVRPILLKQTLRNNNIHYTQQSIIPFVRLIVY